MNGATLKCGSGSICDLYCFGDSCSSMTDYVCYDNAVCYCHGSGCPAVLMTKKVKEVEVIYKFQAFHRVAVQMMDTIDSFEFCISGSMMILAGAGMVVMILMTMFYCQRQYERKEYEALGP